MSSAVNALVKEYLDTAYPQVSKALERDASVDSRKRKRAFGAQTLDVVLSKYYDKSRDDGNSDEDEPPHKVAKKTSPKLAAKKAPIPDSSDDDEPVKKPVAAKKSSPKASPKLAAKKAPIPDSSDDDEPVKKPVAAKKSSPKASPKLAAKKAPIPDSSDDDEPVKKPVAAKRPVAAMESDDDAAPVRKVTRNEESNQNRNNFNGNQRRGGAAPLRNEDGSFRRFQRIDVNAVQFHADALRDNSPRDEHLVLRQNQEMMRAKGKDFNKLKQKNKGKFYGAGVDLTVRSYQFPSSDDD